MEYTEEEKKAIEFFEKRQKNMGDYRGPLKENTDIVLNLIEKQQKEIERLENKDKEYIKILNNNLKWQEKYKELKNDSIPKDKIIKRIDNFFDDIIFVKDINELKKLLKEKLLGE